MRIKFILPTLVEARGQQWRSIKYSLFPPLGLATLAAYLRDGDAAEIIDEHGESLRTDDRPEDKENDGELRPRSCGRERAKGTIGGSSAA